jgi:Cu/Ag efflux protein CusF
MQTKTAFANNTLVEGLTASKAGNKMDARTVVKATRVSQGKIKIKADSIDKHLVSMLFKVSDFLSLDCLNKGQIITIHFNINNSSGGFVITHIVPKDKSADVKREQLLVQVTEVTQTIRGTQFIQIIAPCSLKGAGWLK